MKKAVKIALVLTTLASCVKDAEIEIPGASEQMVVEGYIEPGQPPIVILTRNKPYFGTNNFASFQDLLVHGADVNVSDGNYSAHLFEVCASTLSDTMLMQLATITGIDTASLRSIDFCLYSTFDENIFGKQNKTYYLSINAQGKQMTATTTIPKAIPLESIWYKDEPPYTDRGLCWGRLNDPDTAGNAYRWFAMRKGIDDGFSAPIGSAFEDKFINGQTFEFSYHRAHRPGSESAEFGFPGFYTTGDTIVVKFCTIDAKHYQFWKSYETQAMHYENPFASPTSIRTNIKGGLGIWGGYAVSYHTTVVQ